MKKLVKWLFMPIYGPFFWLFKIANSAREKGRMIEFYAFPILISNLTTFGLTRLFTRIIFRDETINLHSVHIHHFVIGILIQQIVLLYLFSHSTSLKVSTVYKLAILYGVGLGLLLDETDVILHLDSSALAHSYTYGVVYGSLFLIILITTRAIIDTVSQMISKKRKAP